MAGMMTSLLLLLLAGVTVGRVVDLQKRVSGGGDCKRDERLYHVKLETTKDGKVTSESGGSLISEKWILTAEHNVETDETVTAFLNWHPDKEKAVEVKVKGTPHRRILLGKTHDIMLLELEDHKVNIKTVGLPFCGKPLKDEEVQIAGIGDPAVDPKTNKKMNLKAALTLQCGKTTIVPCTNTDLVHNNVRCSRDHEELMCFYSQTVDSTKGDSGGGVVFEERIYGVISAGGNTACAGTADAMDVCKYADWITEVTKLKFP